jgi:hypothetical protein
MELIWVKREEENFSKEGWTGGLQNCPSGKSVCSQPAQTYCAGWQERRGGSFATELAVSSGVISTTAMSVSF